jgi:hypothetical protein
MHGHLQVYWAEHGGWWDGVISDFNVLTGQHWCGSLAGLMYPSAVMLMLHNTCIGVSAQRHDLAFSRPSMHVFTVKFLIGSS